MKYEEYFKDSVYYKYAKAHLTDKYAIQMEGLTEKQLEVLLYEASKVGKDEYDGRMQSVLNRPGLTPKQRNTEHSVALDHSISIIVSYIDSNFSLAN